MTRQQAERYRRQINKVIADLDDEMALDVKELFLPWAPWTSYKAGDRRRHEDGLYRCEQEHTSQPEWTPDATPALWTEISIEEWPAWRQPTGAQDAYHYLDKVSHAGKHWISVVDANTWEPGVYGWEEVTN